MRKNSKIDKQALVECICYLLFAFALLYLVFSGQYLQYVTPRMKPYLLFAAVVLLVWARTAIENLYVVWHRRHCLHCFVLMFPLLMLILPHRSVSVSSVSTPTQSIAAVQTLRGSAAANPTRSPPQRRLHRQPPKAPNLWKAQKQKNSLPQRRSRILRTVQPMQKALTERMKPRIFSATRPRCTATMPQTAILPSPMPSFIHGWT